MATYPTVELNLSGTWTDITTYVRYQDMIEIKRGKSSEASQLDTSSCSMTLDNRDGRFSPRNPTGAYYGSIGRNTPIRVSLDGGLPYLNLPGGAGDQASTPDAAALDITGDIDIRAEMFFLDWNVTEDLEIIGKYLTTGNQRSWLLRLDTTGLLTLFWSNDGTTVLSAEATESLEDNSRSRMAIRVTLDVDNGAGGKTVTFYTANSISGTWTQLGDAVTTATTTSIFASTATLQIGDVSSTGSTGSPTCRVYKAEVYNGIAGTAVANPDFTAQTAGATSFADAAGRTWTISGNATISDRKIRFMGEIASWPVDWDISGTDVTTRIEAAGIIRRLTQGDSPLRSPMFREFTNPARTGILAYWPMEEGKEGDAFASGIEGYPEMVISSGRPTLSASSPYDGSEALPEVSDGSFLGAIPSYTTTNETILWFAMAVPDGGVSSDSLLFTLNGTGSVRRWEVTISTAGALRLLAYDSAGVELTGNGFVAFAVNGELDVVTLELTQNGADIDWRLRLLDHTDVVNVGDTPTSTSTSGTVSTQTVGRIKSLAFGNSTSSLSTTVIGHAALGNDLDTFTNTTAPLHGWRLENPADRLRRLVEDEEEIPLQVHSGGATGNDVRMGIQGLTGLVDLVREVGDTDLGIMFEPRDEIGIAYRTRLSLYNQTARLTLDYSQHQLAAPPIPVDDDQNTRNDITVRRDGGSQYRQTLETGTLSVQAPPSGVGRYESSVTLSIGADSLLPDQAGWRLHVGTVDEARYPVIALNLRHSTFTSSSSTMENALVLDVGDRIVIQDPPSWLPTDDISLLAVGFTEKLGILERDITVNCVPESPYHVAEVEGSNYERVDTDGTTIVEALTTTETDVAVFTQIDSARWADSATYASDFPFDVRVGGEVMTVTACTYGLADDFSAAQVDTWGSADVGGAWTNSGGVAADFDVAGGVGTHTIATVNVRRISLLTAPHSDFDLFCDTTTSATATGGSLFSIIAARYADVNNQYFIRLEFSTANVITMTLRERVAGVETSLGTYSVPFAHVAGTYARVRFQGSGTTLRARIWLTTENEPGDWHISVTDSSLTAAGSMGVWSIASSANTNVNPVVSFDNFNLVNPQVFTATRSVNGVVKTHSSGADVRLAYPAIIPL